MIRSELEREKDAAKNYVLHIGGPEEIQVLDYTAKTAREAGLSFAVFAGDDETDYKFVIEGEGLDARAAGEVLRYKYSAKCGGRDNSIRGNLELPAADIRRLFSDLSLLSM